MIKTKQLSVVIFWGALWGVAEATVGHFLHIWVLPVGWLMWFPLAYSFMWTAYRRTGNPQVIWQMAVVASAIKLMDLLVPIRIDYVMNPAVSILFEGLAVFAAYKYPGTWRIPVASMLWRLFYCIYLLFLPEWLIEISPLREVGSLVNFLLVESAANTIVLYGAFYLRRSDDHIARQRFNPNLAVSLGMLILAVFIQWRV